MTLTSALSVPLAAIIAIAGPVLPAASAGVNLAQPIPVWAQQSAPTADDLVLRYDAPAKNWERESLPIGNGAMGASIFGGVGEETVTLNEKTLWTGGPGVPGYRYGNYPDDDIAWRRKNLQQVRDGINQHGKMTPEEAIALLGQPKVGYGSYQSFGHLKLTVPDAKTYTDYRRELDIGKAIASVHYQAGGTTFTREYLASNPAQVIAMQIGADTPGAVTFTARYDPAAKGQDALVGAQVRAADGRITLSGAAKDNGLRYNAQLQIITDGGDRTDHADGTVTVAGANSAVLIWAGGTDYAMRYPGYRTGTDPAARVTSLVDTGAAAGWDTLRAAHETDYRELFDRVKLDLDGQAIETSTDQALSAYRGNTAQDRSLERLYFQYGRYLLISSSRPGSLPANLQGVWSATNNPPWSADYHTNINLQMNYWPAWSTNLGETHQPYLAYIDNLATAGADSATNVLGLPGWMVMNETTPFGFTGVFDWPTAAWFPEANAWLAQAYYWQYLYTGDVEFLRNTGYPMLRKTAEFWQQYLQHDPRDGSLVANPSFSPEHGDFTAGAAMSQQIAAELFTSTLAAAAVLGISDEFTTSLADTAQRTDTGLHIADGKIQEWKTPGIKAEPRHRHVSQLYALFPGRAISPTSTPELAEAARGTLNDRGDGGTGWSKAWKVNFWASLGDGDRAHTMVSGLLRESTMPNLWDNHPPFQIDGNFGGTSGIAQMLVQNTDDAVSVLPSLPSAWPRGSVDGLRAWHDTTVGVSWADGAATEIRVQSGTNQRRSIRTSLAAGPVIVTDTAGQQVAATVAGGLITFDMVAGQQYRVTSAITIKISAAPTSMDLGQQATLTAHITGVDRPMTVTAEVPEGWQASPGVQWAPMGGGDITITLRAPQTGTDGHLRLRLEGPGTQAIAGVRIPLSDPRPVPTAQMRIVAWDSQELTGELRPNGLAWAAIDGDTDTFWHTQWHGEAPKHPHYLVIDLGKVEQINGLLYTPRANGTTPRNGQIADYRMSVAADGQIPVPTPEQAGSSTPGATDGVANKPVPPEVAFTTVAEGTFSTDATAPVLVEFGAVVSARFVRLESLSAAGAKPWAHAAEIGVLRSPGTASPELPTVPLPPVVQLLPSSADPGQPVSVRFGGMPADAQVSVHIEGQEPVSGRSDGRGFGEVELTVDPARSGGQVTVTVTAGSASASAILTVTGTPAPPATVTASADDAVSGRWQIAGSGFAPGETVGLELHSDPVALGEANTSGEGAFAITVTVPTSVAPGQHAVVATGRSSGRVAQVDILVPKMAPSSSSAVTVLSTTAGVPAATADNGMPATSFASPGQLSKTGASVNGATVLVALVCMMLGGLLIACRSRVTSHW